MSSLGKSIIVLAGLPFSGKTTLGRLLADRYDVPFLDIDETRKEVAPGNKWLGPEKEKTIMLASYKLNHEKAASILSSGKTVILAATYSRESYHDKLRELSITHHVPLKFFLLQIPDEVVKTRLEERILHGSSSNIVSLETYQEVKDRYVTFHGNELIFIDASRPLGKTIEEISTEIENIGPASGKSNLPRS